MSTITEATETVYGAVREITRLREVNAEMGAKLLELWNAGILADNDTHALLTKAGLI